MSQTQVISKDVLEEARGKNIEIVLDMGDYTWTINGKNITGADLTDVNLKVVFDEQEIPQTTLDGVVQNRSYRTVTLEYDGPFGFSADLSFEVGAEHKGKYVNLYYYNEEDQSLEFQNSGVVDANGYTKHTFTHASSYVAVISDGMAEYYEDTTVDKAPKAFWIAFFALWVCLACGACFVLFRRRKVRN